MAYTAELCGCVEDERWEGLPKISAASDYRNASDVCRPPLEKNWGGGTLFSEGGHYSPVNFVLGGNYSPVNYVRGTLFTGELCPGGQYSPVNNVRGDILWGDSVHYDNVLSHIDLRAKTRYTYWNLTQNDSTIRTAGQNEMTTFN